MIFYQLKIQFKNNVSNNYILTLKMVNTTTVKKKRVGKNYFRIVGRPQLHIKGEVIANFTPYRSNQIKQVQNKSIIPTFNNDRKYYTFTFKIPSSCVEDNDEHLVGEHQKRVAESLNQIQEILYPKPRSKHKYCGVCKIHYEDYKDHVESEEHEAGMKKSTYQNRIVTLSSDFQQIVEKKEEEQNNQLMSSEQNVFKNNYSTEGGKQDVEVVEELIY